MAIANQIRIMGKLKQINTIMTVVGIATTTFDLMIKTFKWYEKLHGKKKSEEKDYSIPIIKGM